ncbi:MAG TPA: S-layer homology domain-containing protein [Oculatellaceae cyanobacterium]|jgi:hypothetical protein
MRKDKRQSVNKQIYKKPTSYLLISSLLSSGILYSTASVANSDPIEPTKLANSLPEKLAVESNKSDLLAIAASNTTANQLRLGIPTTEISASNLGNPEVKEYKADTVNTAKLNPVSNQLSKNIVVSAIPEPSVSQPSQVAVTNTSNAPTTTLTTEAQPANISAPETLATNASSLKLNADAVPEVAQPDPQLAQALSFPDVQGHWAQTFITALASREIIVGFPDGTFRPDAPVTRAQFAAMINKAFNRAPIRQAANFVDVPANYWGYDAIQKAYTTGFLAGYPNNQFAPNQNIPRAQVLVSLANGLNLAQTTDTITFQDASDIPAYARSSIAAATANRLVVNYPNVNVLNPNQVATRADVAAFIYQALVSAGQVPPLAAADLGTQYIVGYQPPVATTPTPTPTPVAEIPAGELQDLQTRIANLQDIRFRQIYLSSPSSAGGSPSGFGLDFGDAFIGGSFVERTRFTNSSDGGLSLGFGLGDAARYLGLEILPTISSLAGDDAFQAGSVDFKVHRLLGPDLSIAGGVENLVQFGDQDIDPSGYGVISKVFRLRPSVASPLSRLYTSIGAGGGRFRSEDDILNGNDNINVFGTVGLRVLEPVSAFADWTGQDLNVGVSLLPFRQIPLVITPSLQDVTGTAGDGSRFALSLGYSLSF